MATQKSSGTTKKATAKRAAKKATTRKSAPPVVPAAETPASSAPSASPEPLPAAPADRLTEVARTIGSTMGAIAATTKRALNRATKKK